MILTGSTTSIVGGQAFSVQTWIDSNRASVAREADGRAHELGGRFLFAGVLCVLPPARVLGLARVPGLMIVLGSGWETRLVGEDVLVCKGGIDPIQGPVSC